MGRRRRNEVLGRTQHVYCRGNRSEPVFEDRGDCAAFVEKLFELAAEMKVLVLAYCLMPNHFHLCLRTQEGGAKLSAFMQRLNLWHSRQYNAKHGVRGRLNESRYKAKEVDTELYLLSLVRYIHRNPVRAQFVAKVEDWPHSSHAAYAGGANPGVATAEVLGLVGGVQGYRNLVEAEAKQPEDFKEFRFKRQKLPAPPPRPAISGEDAKDDLMLRLYTTRAAARASVKMAAPSNRAVADLLGLPNSCSEEEAVYLRVA